MGKSRAQTRIDPDTESRVEEYADEREISESEALRRLIEAGLTDKGYPVEGTVRRFDQAGNFRQLLKGGLVLAHFALLLGIYGGI